MRGLDSGRAGYRVQTAKAAARRLPHEDVGVMEAVDEGQRRLAKRNTISWPGNDDARDETRASKMNAG